jgi:hypothetical protein
MTFAAGLALIAAVCIVVAWPFFRRQARDGSTPAAGEEVRRWERQKVEAYGAIKDAEFDFQTGKMSELDFRFIRDKYAARALEAIAALERSRAKPSPPPARSVRFLYCPECGHKLPPRARFCPGCGKPLGRADDAA